jgi:RNA polymerase sigma factor (sigma-70 family)
MPSENREDPIPTRSSLLSRLKNVEDHDSWKDFVETYSALITKTALHAGLTEIEAEDVVQETVLAVSKRMPHFHYDRSVGSFKGWLLKLTHWKIKEHMRQKDREVSWEGLNGDAEALMLEEYRTDPTFARLEALWDREWEQNLFEAALVRIKSRANLKEYQIFNLNVLQNWPTERVCAALGISQNRVWTAKCRVSKLLKREVGILKSQFQ